MVWAIGWGTDCDLPSERLNSRASTIIHPAECKDARPALGMIRTTTGFLLGNWVKVRVGKHRRNPFQARRVPHDLMRAHGIRRVGGTAGGVFPVYVALILAGEPVNNRKLAELMQCSPGEASRRVAQLEGAVRKARKGREVMISLN